ncbi:MAG: hypothetical protein ACOCQD_01605 [archaeon]
MLKDLPLSKDKSDIKKVRVLLSRIVGNEFSNIAHPCYKPKIIKYWRELQHVTGIDDNLIQMFKENLPEYLKQRSVLVNKQTLLILIGIIHYTRIKEYNVAKLFHNLLTIKFYGNRVQTHFKNFCREDLWNLALGNLSEKHLFSRYNGIAGAINYLSDEMYKRYEPKIKSSKMSDTDVQNMIYVLRHRVAQSVRSFANMYYKLFEQKRKGIVSTGEEVSETSINVIASKIVLSMNTYGDVDNVALSKAIKSSGMRRDLGLSVVRSLSRSEHSDDIRFIIILIDRINPIKSVCIERKRNALIRKVQSGVKFGKYTIKNQILELLNSLNVSELRTVNDHQKTHFFLEYLTAFIRNRVC